MKTTKVRIQPLSWFEENAHKDNDNDYWENEETAGIYFKYQMQEKIDIADYEKFFYTGTHVSPELTYGKVIDVDNFYKSSWEWAVQEYITQDKYPEYFL